jgi:iron-sulfur cluster assembly accessory protein
MSTVTENAATTALPQVGETAAPPLVVTEKAAGRIKQIIEEQHAAGETRKIYLRVRVVGGGCSGFQNKLELDSEGVNPKVDEEYEIHGVPVLVDKRSALYLNGATVDFHDELNRTGFSISNPAAKSTCGCGSSYSM